MRQTLLLAICMASEPLLPGGAFAWGQLDEMSYLAKLRMTTQVRPNDEIRALWVVRDALTSVASVDRVVDFAAQTHFHMMFVQVRGRGDAYYRSKIAPPGAGLEAPVTDFDPLDYLIIRARRAGISVHAWFNMFYVWSDPDSDPSPGHVVTEHPEWLLKDVSGEPMNARDPAWWQRDGIEGYYLSPELPEVRRHLVDAVSELVSAYALDGVHLDYVRYPNAMFGLSPRGRSEFALAYGVDPARLANQTATLVSLAGKEAVAVLDSLYREERCRQIDLTVQGVREVTRGMALSAAVVPDPVLAREEKGQDWARWVHRRDVDFVVTMAYNHSPDGMATHARMLSNLIGRDRFLVGIALHDGRDAFLVDSVAALRGERAAGFAIFSYNVLDRLSFPAAFIEDTIFSGLENEDTE